LSTYTLSGHVTTSAGAALSGQQMVVSGGANTIFAPCYATTDVNGNYSFLVAANGNYFVTAPNGFTPGPIPFPNVVANATGNFSAIPTGQVSISGYVVLGGTGPAAGTGVAGATVTLAGSQTGSYTTVAGGSYSFTVNAGGNYTVSATLPHYAMSTLAPWNDLVSSVSPANFTATFQSGGSLSPGSPNKEYIFMNGSIVAVEHPH
jgi:hypothetical protein